MAVRSGLVFVDSIPDVPVVRQAVGRIEMAVDRLVDHLVAAPQIPVERHERIAGA